MACVLQLHVRKMYASPMFEDMMPMLALAKRHSLEQVRVDKTGVMFRLLHPAGNEMVFFMRSHGYPYLTEERQEAMRVLLEECIPKLAERDKYEVMRRRNRLINGDVEYEYSYTMRNAYKNKLVRAQYYDGTLEARLW